jgi:benzoyl-CoA reductase/2-hydroxyglutaryl-CoA dehydratase subunit BcrC/BadD/HgdB
MLIKELTESQLENMLERRKQLASAKTALYAGDLDTTLNIMSRLSYMGFPRQGITAFFDRYEKKVKPIVLNMAKHNNDLVEVYNVTGDLIQAMRVNWPWLYMLRQELKQQLNL